MMHGHSTSETITSNVCAVGLEKLDHGRTQKVHAQEDAYNDKPAPVDNRYVKDTTLTNCEHLAQLC